MNPATFESINLHTITLSQPCLLALDSKFITKHKCLIFDLQDSHISIALSCENAPLGLITNHINSLFPHKSLKFFLASSESFAAQLESITDFQAFKKLQDNLLFLLQSQNQHNDDERAAIALLDYILELCIKHRASDIHFESQDSIHCVRIRVDGMLREILRLQEAVFESLSACLKLECKLDINQKRQAQDGRFSRVFDSKAFDFRLSVLPTFSGESLVLRILHKNAKIATLQELGFHKLPLQLITHFANSPSGLILLSGPTGSGKSTTLYAILESIKSPSKKIITLEDPIEYRIHNTTQVLVNDKHHFGFSNALKALLRHDPDILMIGEIRDENSLDIALRASLTGHLVLSTIHANDSLSVIERLLDMGAKDYLLSIRDENSLDIALRASLTGHLVLSTIHANDSLSVIERLLDMGAKDYLLSSTLRLLISQRLVRRLCPYCKIPLSFQQICEKFESFKLETHILEPYKNARFYTSSACQHCYMQGYNGRLLIAECLENSSLLQHYIQSPQDKEIITKELQKGGFESMFEAGIKLLAQGQTSFEEIYRVCRL